MLVEHLCPYAHKGLDGVWRQDCIVGEDNLYVFEAEQGKICVLSRWGKSSRGTKSRNRNKRRAAARKARRR
jgi:hypothetical protein